MPTDVDRFGELLDELLIPDHDRDEFAALLRDGLDFGFGEKSVQFDVRIRQLAQRCGFEVEVFDGLLDLYRTIAPRDRHGLLDDFVPHAAVHDLAVPGPRQPESDRVAC